MLAWWVEEPGPMAARPLRMGLRPDPSPRAREILLAVHACGICRTDLHLAEGDLVPHAKQVIPGHEVVGEVVALGSGCVKFRIGDRAGAAWLLCAGIIGYRALRRAALPPGGRLGIYGFGASAHLTAQMAMFEGASVYVMTRSEDAQSLALRLGVAFAGGAEALPPARLDAAILFAPAGNLVPVALQALDRGGTLAIAGIHMSDIPVLNYERDLFQERQLCSVTANTRADGREFFALARKIPLQPTTVLYPLEEADHALQDLSEARVTGAAVLLANPR